MSELRGKVLIVDDEAQVVGVLRDYFQGAGFEVFTAASGAEALETFGRERPDVVLLDVRMPEMDGLEVLRRIRATGSRAGVVMITGQESVEAAKESAALGAADYILKPFDFDHLRRAVDRVLIAAAMAGGQAAAAPARASGDLVYDLALELLRAARVLPAGAHTSVGAALESAALGLVQRSGQAEKTELIRMLNHVRTLLRLGRDLGDFADEAHLRLESCLVKARRALGFD